MKCDYKTGDLICNCTQIVDCASGVSWVQQREVCAVLTSARAKNLLPKVLELLKAGHRANEDATVC